MTQTLAAQTAPVLSEAMVREYANELVEKAATSRVLALRGNPSVSYPEVIETVGGQVVHIRPCVSSLAVRAVLVDAEPEDFVVIITDRPKEDLGETLTAQFREQRVVLADTWHSVARLFDATRVDRDLRDSGPVVADALLRHSTGHYPAAPSGVLTLNHAMKPLTERLLGISADELSPIGLLNWTQDQRGRDRWRSEDSAIRLAVSYWVAQEVGPVGGLALAIGGSPGSVDGIVVGLAADVLWPSADAQGNAGVSAEALGARVRLEKFVGGHPVDPSAARKLADAARGILLRMSAAADPSRSGLMRRAQVLLTDVQWSQGAQVSTVLPEGYGARLRALSAALSDALDGRDVPTVEARLASLFSHESARTDFAADTERAEMAVRLMRWLVTPDPSAPGRLADALSRQMVADAWVDRAIADVSAGSNDESVASAYATLCQAALDRRQVHDVQFAELLAGAAEREVEATGVLLIEDVLSSVVKPLAAVEKVLLIVVDGMSTSVAAELADGAIAKNWSEVVPVATGKRMTALAALPTLTTHSRTSLLTGELQSGTQLDEKRVFPKVAGGPIFHKDDLRAGLGQALAPAVREAINGSSPIVGVVLNTVDDTLAKHDPDGTDWTIENVQHLGPLLEVAASAGRTVVMTSDHGHVVERGGEGRSVAGAENRWRSLDSGPAGNGEVLIEGRRVLAGGGKIVAPSIEGLRYAHKAAGYHGGATPAEATVPVIVLVRDPEALGRDWVWAPSQSPTWWYEPATSGASEPTPPATTSTRRKVAPQPPPADVLFVVPPDRPTSAAPGVSLVDQLIASSAYRRQRARAGRAALRDEAVAAVVTTLLAGGGRADRDAVAAAAGMAPARFNQALAMLRRILNVEGYEVVGLDADQHTVVLGEALLRTQFGLGDPS